ncbi:MAG: DNA gyrase C-terminal beta-propeller domain-containing protein, partial [Gemmatimonadota bacterium]
FGAILIALDHGQPREMTLKELLEAFRDHRLEVIRRRAEHDLEEAREEAHITEGLLVALDEIEAVIALIRKAKDRADAAKKLRKRFELSERQAAAILDMRLARLTALETRELKARLKELEKLIGRLEKLLGSRKRQLDAFIAELDELVETYGDARRTTIVEGDAEIAVEDMIAQEDVVITLSHEGYLKRIPMYLYKRRVSSGKPLAGMERYETDFLEHAFIASTHDALLFFTDDGRAHALPVHEAPEAGRRSRGKALSQLLEFEGGDRVAALVSVSEFDEERALVFLTRDGTVKRTTLDNFANVRAGGINAINVKDDDRLLDVQLSDGTNDLVLVTRRGRAIRFPEADISTMGRTARGVRGIKLREGDEVVGMVLVKRDATLCTVTEQGYAKRTPVSEYSVQRRGGLGTVTLKVTKATGPLVAAKELLPGDELMVIAASGAAVRLAADEVPEQGRNTQGRQLIRPEKGDRVVEVARVAQRDGSVEPGGGEGEEGEPLALVAEAGE